LNGKKVTVKVLRSALSLELFHLYLLIHDDVMDKGDTRRGGMSLHKMFEIVHHKKQLRGNAEHYGLSMAILVGDMLASKSETLLPPDLTLQKSFYDLKKEVYWGQHLDISLSYAPHTAKKADIVRLMRTKTGAYSIWRPLRIGARYGGLSKKKSSWTKDFGTNLGIAFQIVDDILGTFGTVSTGKSVSSDIAERKPTLLLYYCRESAEGADKKAIEAYLQSTALKNISAIKLLFEKYTVKEKAQRDAKVFLVKALRSLNTAPLAATTKELFENFARFIVERIN
jgi:geranylgeranyl diphosphate synthase, type I